MNEEDAKSTETEKEEKPGFFTRMVNKLDASMKEKADEQAKESDCCSGDDGKGGKCC